MNSSDLNPVAAKPAPLYKGHGNERGHARFARRDRFDMAPLMREISLLLSIAEHTLFEYARTAQEYDEFSKPDKKIKAISVSCGVHFRVSDGFYAFLFPPIKKVKPHRARGLSSQGKCIWKETGQHFLLESVAQYFSRIS